MKYQATRLSAACVLLACFSQVMAQERAADHAVVVIDLRPKEEREGTGISPVPGKCNEDMYRIADSASNPSKVAALQSELAAQLRGAGAGKTLTVLNWTIYFNRLDSERWLRIVPVQGIPLPGSHQAKIPAGKCSRQESAGGWFDPSEVTGKYLPLVSVLKVTFAGTPLGVRIVHSPQSILDGQFTGGAADSQAVLDAVHKTAAALVAILPR
jgi:hypothetical protein